MKNIKMTFFLLSFILCGHIVKAQATVEEFKQTFEAQLQKLKPTGFSKRTVSFMQVTKGTANGGYYPFKVTAYIHDYGAGYPANRYYGQTCMRKMDGWKFDMRKDDFGEWIVQGRFTVTGEDAVCKENPSEGSEAIPLAGVPGTVYEAGKAVSKNEKPIAKTKTSNLYIGEYACYGTGGSLMAGMGFLLQQNGRYSDLDGKRAGNYTYNAQKATIEFKSGFLGGQIGKNVKQTGFQLSNTVYAEPWR